MKHILYLLCFSTLVSCGYFNSEKPLREANGRLSLEHAKQRKAMISDVNYELQFDLTEKENFQGTTALHFKLTKVKDITIDFVGGEVQELVINGEPMGAISYNGFFIQIPGNVLKRGANSVLVKFTHSYSNNGAGLYRYVDAKDGSTYLYSMFEPYNANKMFPCFDQPNLKATYKTRVLTPKGWQVITADREIEKVERGDFEEWFFPQSAKFSTYTYSLHAGEYVVWEDVAKTKKHEIPLRLFARKSLAPYVKTEDWFTWTKQGFVFFEKYFSHPYPYSKYDQVIVPDFNHGAMENVGAVTFNEDRFVSKGEKTRAKRRRLAVTLFHEMAHMWFGNLVTMDWWDDLWLNESFATYSSYVGIVNATEFKESWQNFNSRAKQRAYRQDQSTNTHPIAQDCPHTDAAFANFDAITYGKGASVMKQLSYLLGDKIYKRALKNYFQKYATKNTVLNDFIGEMEIASGRDLKQWTGRWLKTAMVNDVEVHFTCKKGHIKSFEIFQTGTAEYPTLRRHKTQLALFKSWRGIYKLNKTLSVEYAGERTPVPSLVGRLCPDIVYPNYKDHDFVSVTLDKRSLANIESSLATVDDSFVKNLLWADLWNMVLNKKMPMSRFLEVAEFNGMRETDADIINSVFNNVHTILQEYYPDSGHPWVSQREVWVKFFEQAYLTKISNLVEQPEAQKVWYSHLVDLAESAEVLKNFEKILNQHRSGLPLNFIVDQDMRWELLASLSRNNYPGVETLLDKEKKRDLSKRGKQRALFVSALLPDLEQKKKSYKAIVGPSKNESFGDLRAMMMGLFPAGQKSIQKKFVDSFYATLKSFGISADGYYSREFTEQLVPAFCDQKSSTQMANFLKAEKGLNFGVAKELQKALFENKRCYEMRKVLKSGRRLNTNAQY